MKDLYMNLSNPLQFITCKQNSGEIPMGWIRASRAIDSSYEYNKLKVLTEKEVLEVRCKVKGSGKNA